jgi:hypothetical protein
MPMLKKLFLLAIVLYSQNTLTVAAHQTAFEALQARIAAAERTLALQKKWLSFNVPAAFCTFSDPITTGVSLMIYEGFLRKILRKMPIPSNPKHRLTSAVSGGLWHAFAYALYNAYANRKHFMNGWGIVIAHTLTSLGMEYGYDLLRYNAKKTKTKNSDSFDFYGLDSAKWAATTAVAQVACYLIQDYSN